MTYPKRLIEVDLPIKRISAHARREKSIRHGHISTLHIWWARRPLAACRAVICAALWPDPADPNCPQAFRDAALKAMVEFAKATQTNQWSDVCDPGAWQRYMRLASGQDVNVETLKGQQKLRSLLLDFIADFAAWEASTNAWFLDTARTLTQAAHEALGGEKGTRPLVVDPFAGGGAIPLEALRVGADAFASDLNPVAVLLNKVVLEYIPKYGQKLADEVRKWGAWVKEQAEKELSPFYPKDPDGATPIAYLWARTIQCEGPGCGAEVPLMRSLWLAKKGSRSVALRLVPNPEKKRVDFEIVREAKAKDVGEGTVRRGSATCPCCGYTTPADRVRNQFKGRDGGAADARLLAVVTTRPTENGRHYRLANRDDVAAVAAAQADLRKRAKNESVFRAMFPHEPLPYLRSIFNIHLLDVKKWMSLFTPRQLLAISALSRAVHDMQVIIQGSGERDFANTIATCLALAVDRQADYCSSLCRWVSAGEFLGSTFARQALGIIWDFAEVNPFGQASGDFEGALGWVAAVCEKLSAARIQQGHAEIASATRHPLPDDSAAAAISDPPYYDAVPYADLSDFFYVWLKRTLAGLHDGLFREETSPKQMEVVQLAERNPSYAYKSRDNFERLMTDALGDMRRVTVPTGLGVFVFAHKATAAWEAMLQAVIDAGWVAVASWPIDTERQVRLRAIDSAALGSSVHLVCRPREDSNGAVRSNEIGDWREVLTELPARIREWMKRLGEEGVVGADAIFACLGPALEIFSRYSKVEKASGEQVLLKEYLTHVWGAVAQEAVAQVFKEADAAGFEEDARLTAIWLWTLSAGASPGPAAGDGAAAPDAAEGEEAESGAEEADDGEEAESSSGKAKAGGYVLEFDAARMIAQGLGAHLEQLSGVVEIKGDKARLLGVAERTRRLFGKDQAEAPAAKRKKKDKQLKLFGLQEVEAEQGGWGEKSVPKLGDTALDRVHQAMILFAAGRGEALRRFLVEDGAGRDQRFWKLANALSALYPPGTDEKRWVDGVLARKKGLGL